MTARLTAALALACLGLLLGGGAVAAPPVVLGPPATAEGLAVLVIGADQTVTASTPDGAAPPAATIDRAPFAYPEDGSVVSTEWTSVTVSSSAVDGTSTATTEVSKLSLFGGEVTADEVRASVSSAGTIGDLSDSVVSNLTVLGAPVAVAPNAKLPLADWGSLSVLSQTTKQGTKAQPSWRGTVTALVVHLDADHGGLPAGSEIRIGFADAFARPPAAKTTPKRSVPAKPAAKSRAKGKKPVPLFVAGASVSANARESRRAKPKTTGPVVLEIPDVTPKLTAGGYVFPVYGPSAYGDTFGAPRGDVSSGWHHGGDVFAPLGAPLLAVADGTVFSVGWNDIGGYRLWLRDRAGNEFYYAHLSAYTSLAVNGRRVKAGDVLGFIGNTGDAQGTPFHVHFEVHPVTLLFLGYDGAVNPTRYLDAWKRLVDVRILPAVPFATPAAEVSSAPTPGAILLQSSDISTANGLDPGSLRRAMNAPATADVTVPRVAQLPSPLPVLDRA